jgi:fatty acid desaturase
MDDKLNVGKKPIEDRALLKSLGQTSDLKGSIDMLLRLGLHVVSVYFGYSLLTAGRYPLAIAILIPHFIAYSFLGWAGIGHELFHNSVFSIKPLNNLLFKLFSILTWNNYGYFAVTHWKHHRDTLLPDDPEGAPEQGLRPSTFPWLFTIDLPGIIRRIKILSYNSVGIIPGPLGTTLFAADSAARRGLVIGARYVLGFHAALLIFFLYSVLYWCILLITLAPFILTIFNRLLAVSQHFGTTSDAPVSYFTSTRTCILGPFLSFLYANMNYHVEHHFYPYIPYYNLPLVHREIRKKHTFPHFSNGWLNMLRDLKRLGCFR